MEPKVHEPLASAFRSLAEDDSALGASPRVELRLLDEVRSIAAARRRWKRTMIFAVAAVAILGVAIPVWRHAALRPVNDPRALGGAAANTPADDPAAPFFPLGFSEVPATGAHLVRIEVPRTALRSFGVTPIDAPGASLSSPVLADVLVGDDGLARAVRFVRVTRIQEQQR